MTEHDLALESAMSTAYWLVKEGLPVSKFGSLIKFMKLRKCPHLHNLSVAGNASYMSDVAANEMIDAMSHVIQQNTDEMLKASPTLSILADESTDLTVDKKLVLYGRVVDPTTFIPTTKYLTNIELGDATGKAIANEIVSFLDSKDISIDKLSGFGSDGASVMTGRKNGTTGKLLEQNPALINIHCMAHRLALCTSQAANQVTYLKEYQTTVTSIFYYFKHSANRVHKMKEIQDLLDDPVLRYTEVHDVRWLSFYKAIETIFRTLSSLLTFFGQEKDAKGTGISKKLDRYEFVSTTYLMMAVLPVVTRLSLIFQKKDLDVTMVDVCVTNCINELEKLKAGGTENTYMKQLKIDVTKNQNKFYFKGTPTIYHAELSKTF